MPNKIVVIVSRFLLAHTKDALDRLNLPCDLTVVPYDNYEHILQVYDQYADSADGFLVSGRSAKEAIRLASHKPVKPIVYFQLDEAALYKAILQIFLENPEQDPDRVVIDALLPIEGSYTVKAFLARLELESLDQTITQWVVETSARDKGGVQIAITEMLTQLWQQGKIDTVICQYSSIIPALEERGIPYRHPFITDHALGEFVRKLLVKIELEQLRESLPAFVTVVPRYLSQVTQEQCDALEKGITHYFNEHLTECVVHKYLDCYNVVATIQEVKYFTRNFYSCSLSTYLNEILDFEVVVGYGIGCTANQAWGNAQAAVREAAFIGKSFIKDETGNLIGPLGSSTQLVVETLTPAIEDIGELARRCSLSTMTIQKMIAYVKTSGTSKITTHELSKRFGVTVRNANRILINLCKGGAAKPVYTQTSTSRGRPVKVYELDFGALLEA